jgi:outer membrane receptor protein involved in Fe transport
MLRTQLFAGTAIAVLAAAPAVAGTAADPGTLPAALQSSSVTETAEDEEIQSAKEIVVQADIGFRNRSEDAEPVLVYDEEYFQRFEPLTAGDALKRVPGVTFLSDVIESDGARLRGLDPGYTQILINGERVPGGNADRSFFLDRIPAELIQQVEIVRSSSARRTGDAVAGSLNIVLRDGYSLDGGYVRAAGLFFDDGEVKPAGGFYYGGELAGGRVLVGANIQGRYNPKIKSSFRYGDSPENNPDFLTEEFDNREDQTDTRDGTDYAFNASWGIETETTEFEILGNFVRTDRTETERSFEYNDETAISGSVFLGGALLTDNANINEIEQDTWSVAARLEHEWSLGETSFRATFARFDGQEDEVEYEIDFEEEEPFLEGTRTLTDVVDDELSFQLDHEFELSDGIEFVIGGFLQFKERDSDIIDTGLGEDNDGIALNPSLQNWDQFRDSPLDVAIPFNEFENVVGGVNAISEDRTDLFALVEIERGDLKAEAGVRWENTSVEVNALDEDDEPVSSSTDYDVFLPSASLKYDIGRGRITASVARTLRRPRLDFLSPVVLEEEIGDSDFIGNPNLRPETAWGGDIGYEHRIGRDGVIGVNVFYRDISNLTELAVVVDADGDPVPGSESDEETTTFIFQPQNIGSGEVYGIEFDASFSLAFLGLANTGVFGNLAILDSEVRDALGERRFNDQSEYVYNFGAIQNIPEYGAAFGATYRKQGTAFGRVIAEEVTTRYGADLEVFIEKRFGDSFTIRAVGSNLFDGTKDEVFNKFDNLDDQIDREFDEYEIESERAGPVFQVVARYAF